MAELPHASVTQTTEQTTTSSTYVDVPGTEITSGNFVVGRKYLIIARADISGGDSGVECDAKLVHGSTDFPGSRYFNEPVSSTARLDYFYWTVWTAIASEGVKLQFRSDDGATVMRADQIVITAIEISEELREGIDWSFDEVIASTALEIPWSTTNNASVTFTPQVAGQDWLVFGVGQNHSGAASNQLEARVVHGADVQPIVSEEREVEQVDEKLQSTMRVYNLPATGQTFTQQSRIDEGIATPADTREYSSVFAINLNLFKAQNSEYNASGINLGNPSFGTLFNSLAITPVNAGDVIGFGYVIRSGSVTSNIMNARLQVDNVDTPPTQTADDYTKALFYDTKDLQKVTMFSISNQTAGLHTYDWEGNGSTGGQSGQGQDRALVLFTLDLLAEINTFSVDAILEPAFVLFDFTTDAIVVNRNTTTWANDALIQATQDNVFTIDAMLKAIQDNDFTNDGLIQRQNIDNDFTVDARINVIQTNTFSVDAFLRETKTNVTSVDGLLLQGTGVMWENDALLLATQAQVFSIDSILVNVNTTTWTNDARLILRQTLAFTANAIVVNRNTATFSVDAIARKVNVLVFSVNACILGQQVTPDSDISNAGAWVPQIFSTLFQELDNLPQNPSQFIRFDGTRVPVPADSFEVGMGDMADPNRSDGHVVKIVARANTTGPVADDLVKFRIKVFQDLTTLIATTPFFTMPSPTNFITLQFVLSGAEADAITNYMTLSFRGEPTLASRFTNVFSGDAILV